jgi:hypothetical protein
MRTELLNRRRWSTRLQLANAIFEYIEGSTTAADANPRSAGGRHESSKATQSVSSATLH